MGVILNFDNVKDNEQSTSTFKVVKKGAQVLTITNIEEGESASGKPFLKVTFRSERDDADFSHNFFLTEKALPKVMDLIKGATGNKPTGSLDTSVLPELLIGSTSNYVVDATIREREKDGKVYKNEYPTFLRFRDFANKTTPFKDEDAKTEDQSVPSEIRDASSILSNVKADDDDLPF